MKWPFNSNIDMQLYTMDSGSCKFVIITYKIILNSCIQNDLCVTKIYKRSLQHLCKQNGHVHSCWIDLLNANNTVLKFLLLK